MTACTQDGTGKWTDKYGVDRDWFDCGSFRFDGKYNVVTFPRGMTMYHGSGNLAWFNVVAPLGKLYFQIPPDETMTAMQRAALKAPTIPLETKKKVLRKLQPVSLGWYGDYDVALDYSMGPVTTINEPFLPKYPAGVRGEQLECGVNCIAAYRLKKDATFIDMYDPFNLKVLLSDDSPLSAKEKAILIESQIMGVAEKDGPSALRAYTPERIQDLQTALKRGNNIDPTQKMQHAFHPIRRTVAQSRRHSMRRLGDTDQYQLPQALIRAFESQGYAGYVNPRTPYVDDLGTLMGGVRFAEMVFGENVLEYIDRDYANPRDWQSAAHEILPPVLMKLTKDMQRYLTSNIEFHAGDLYQHSLWVGLFTKAILEGAMGDGANPDSLSYCLNCTWAEGLHRNEEVDTLLISTAFLHDIGKAGDDVTFFYDKPAHPEIGAKYVLGQRAYRVANGTAIDLSAVLKEMGVSSSAAPSTMAALIRGHWDFGEHLKHLTSSNMNEVAKSYVDTILGYIDEMKVPLTSTPRQGGSSDIDQFFRWQMLLSAADVMGMQPYRDVAPWVSLQNELRAAINASGGSRVAMMSVNKHLNTFFGTKSFALANRPKVHRGRHAYIDFDYQGRGLALRRAVLTRIAPNQMDVDL